MSTNQNHPVRQSLRDADNLVDDMSNRASRMADKAVDATRDKAVKGARAGRGATADYIRSLGNAVHAASESLKEDGYTRTAGTVDRAGEKFEHVSKSVSGMQVSDIIDDTADYLRRRPALTFSLAALAGYALIKLSDNNRSGRTLS
jgi:hypothetical protein